MILPIQQFLRFPKYLQIQFLNFNFRLIVKSRFTDVLPQIFAQVKTTVCLINNAHGRRDLQSPRLSNRNQVLFLNYSSIKLVVDGIVLFIVQSLAMTSVATHPYITYEVNLCSPKKNLLIPNNMGMSGKCFKDMYFS